MNGVGLKTGHFYAPLKEWRFATNTLGRRQRTIEVMQGMLKWNPNDNQGIRFLITSEYLRAGEATRASRILKKEGDHFRPINTRLR